MDAKQMGMFISELRKENNMTQAQLAKELYVSDKAVSRWERGLGFPDINTIEPLAEALNEMWVHSPPLGAQANFNRMEKRDTM